MIAIYIYWSLECRRAAHNSWCRICVADRIVQRKLEQLVDLLQVFTSLIMDQ